MLMSFGNVFRSLNSNGFDCRQKKHCVQLRESGDLTTSEKGQASRNVLGLPRLHSFVSERTSLLRPQTCTSWALVQGLSAFTVASFQTYSPSGVFGRRFKTKSEGGVEVGVSVS